GAGGADIRRTVHDEAERTLAAVLAQQHHGAREVRVAKLGHREQERGGQTGTIGGGVLGAIHAPIVCEPSLLVNGWKTVRPLAAVARALPMGYSHGTMRLDVYPTDAEAFEAAAALVAEGLRALGGSGALTVALGGGRSGRGVMVALAARGDLPWDRI